MTYYVGVDVGGTSVKIGVVSSAGSIVSEVAIATGAERPQEVVLQDILEGVRQAVVASGLGWGKVRAVGVGCPGMVRAEEGTVLYNNNLGWRDFLLGPMLTEALDLPARVENDANAAALGEVVGGCARGATSAMIITLGTGVGSGFVIDGRIWAGYNSAACEFGHMVIVRGGRPCTCGRRGCFEAYASATGLIAMTNEAIATDPEGAMAEMARREGCVGGHTSFVAAEAGDPAAMRLVDEYTDYLACGVANLVNGLQPEVVGVGGGVGKQGERLLVPLRRKVSEELYGRDYEDDRATRLVSCTLGYKAGLVGAAMAAKVAYGE